MDEIQSVNMNIILLIHLSSYEYEQCIFIIIFNFSYCDCMYFMLLLDVFHTVLFYIYYFYIVNIYCIACHDQMICPLFVTILCIIFNHQSQLQ